jgi:hypothetical protein
MAKKRADTISAANLAKSVESAVGKLKVEKGSIEPGLQVNGTLIIGRWLRESVTLETANALAQEITAQVSKSAALAAPGSLKPAVLAVDRRIICGFIDPSRTVIAFDG